MSNAFLRYLDPPRTREVNEGVKAQSFVRISASCMSESLTQYLHSHVAMRRLTEPMAASFAATSFVCRKRNSKSLQPTQSHWLISAKTLRGVNRSTSCRAQWKRP